MVEGRKDYHKAIFFTARCEMHDVTLDVIEDMELSWSLRYPVQHNLTWDQMPDGTYVLLNDHFFCPKERQSPEGRVCYTSWKLEAVQTPQPVHVEIVDNSLVQDE